MEQLTLLEDFVAELNRRARAESGRGKSIKHFAVTRTTVNALLPRDLFAYAVLPFDESGQVSFPDGSERRQPMFFAINRDQPGSVQVSSFLSSVLSTLHRQSILEAVEAGRRRFLSGFVASVNESDRSAREEADRLIRASYSARHIGPIVERLLNFGWDLSFEYRTAIRDGLDEVRASMRFFGAAYNELNPVRDAIDKVAYAVASAGWHVSGSGNEEVRAFLESRLRSMNLKQILAQFTRDTELLGTGCMVFTSVSDVRVRLIKPTDIQIQGWRPGSEEGEVIDQRTSRSWRLSEVMLHRGVEQEGSPYGLSVLEPAMPTIQMILQMKRSSTELREIKRKIEEGVATGPTAGEVQSRIDGAEEAESAGEEQLKRLFWFPEKGLRLDRTELYLPGQERWVP